MERLSDRAIAVVNELHTERLDYQSEYLPLIDALNQLAAYEDTRITPEALKKPFTEDALLILAASVLRIGVDRLRELAQAEKDGRLLVLPCGPGAEITRDGETFKADHWNVSLTAFREEHANRSGLQVAVFSIEEAKNHA